MRSLERLLRAGTTALLAACTSSCFAVTDLQRFESASGASGDLSFSVRGFTSHVNEMFEYRIVAQNDNTLQARGIIVPLGGPDAAVFAPGAVPKLGGPFNLDFYADHDSSGGYDRDPVKGTGDHSWRIPLTDAMLDAKGGYVVQFDHNTSFAVLENPEPPREIGAPATIHLTKMEAFVGKRVQMRVAVASSKRVVALYRLTTLAAPTASVTIPGMIERGEDYTVEIYTDSGAANPGAARAFRLDGKGGAAGLDVTFDPATAPEIHDAAPP
jgi:hypothetical protein